MQIVVELTVTLISASTLMQDKLLSKGVSTVSTNVFLICYKTNTND